MDDLLHRVTAFPPLEPLSATDYDKQARNLVSLLHQGKVLNGAGELINVREEQSYHANFTDALPRFYFQLSTQSHISASSIH